MSRWFAARRAEAWLAIILLTRLPAPRLVSLPGMGAAVWAYPLAGLAVGSASAAVLLAGLGLGLPPMLAAGLALATGILITGGLHEDGLADLADGFGGGADRARKLAIMRDSRVGSYGVLALVLSVGLRWQAVATMAAADPTGAALSLIGVAAASRAAPAVALALLPPAREEGLGRGASAPPRAAVLAACLLATACLATTTGRAAPLVMLAMALGGIAVGRLAQRQIGGQTGDVLGAVQQAAEIAALLVLAC